MIMTIRRARVMILDLPHKSQPLSHCLNWKQLLTMPRKQPAGKRLKPSKIKILSELPRPCLPWRVVMARYLLYVQYVIQGLNGFTPYPDT